MRARDKQRRMHYYTFTRKSSDLKNKIKTRSDRIIVIYYYYYYVLLCPFVQM